MTGAFAYLVSGLTKLCTPLTAVHAHELSRDHALRHESSDCGACMASLDGVLTAIDHSTFKCSCTPQGSLPSSVVLMQICGTELVVGLGLSYSLTCWFRQQDSQHCDQCMYDTRNLNCTGGTSSPMQFLWTCQLTFKMCPFHWTITVVYN